MTQGRRTSARGWWLIAASLLMVLALAGVGLEISGSAAHRAENVQVRDRQAMADTLAGLTDQYLQLAFQQEQAVGAAGWELTEGSVRDGARLRQLVTASPLFAAGAEVLGPNGFVLSAVEPLAPLPGLSGPVLGRMLASLRQGRPGLSSVVTVGQTPAVAFAVPALRQGRPAGVLVAFGSLAKTPLQTYVQTLRLPPSVVDDIVDSNRVVVASTRPDRLGQTLPEDPALTAVQQGHTGFLEYVGDADARLTTSYVPLAAGRWSLLLTEPAQSFFGAIRDGHRLFELFLALALLIGVASLIVVTGMRHRMLTEIAEQAYLDPLTGLLNRGAFHSRLEEAVAGFRRDRRPVGVLFCDVDGFKALNDARGHEVGDAALTEMGRRLRAVVRDVDVVARVGGDEFTVLLDRLDRPEEVAEVAQRLHDRLRGGYGEDGIPLSLSVGAAVLVADDSLTDGGVEELHAELMRAADLAMYRAKRTGCGVEAVRLAGPGGVPVPPRVVSATAGLDRSTY